MAIYETIKNSYYRIRNSTNTGWERIAFWTMASQVERASGANLEAELAMAYLVSNKTLYVSPTGSDTTGDGTSGKPYKTVNKALAMTPKNMNGYWLNLHIMGGTYTESVVIQGFGGARVYLILNGNVTLNGSVFITDCDSSVQVQSLTGQTYTLTINNTTDTKGAIAMSSCKMIYFGNSITINSTTRGINVYGGSGCSMAGNVIINNTTEYAVVASQSSRLGFANLLAGSSNSGIGVRTSDGSVVSYDPNQFTLSATTLKQTADGGIITNDLASQSQITALDAKIGSKVVVSATAPADTSAVWVY